MEQEKNTKLGLSAEDVRQKGGAAGEKLAGLFRAMGDAECDAVGIAQSEDGRLIGELMNLMQWKEDSPECLAYWAGCGKGLKKELHGNPADVYSRWASYVPLAAREECVVIAPENENLDNILSLLSYAKSHYPIDPGRVYSIGYSFGGLMSSRNTMARPELFAGVGMGGMLFVGASWTASPIPPPTV